MDHTRPKKIKKLRRKDMSKKIVAMLMAVAMAFSLLPVTAFATGEDTPVTPTMIYVSTKGTDKADGV